jgi:hypothetical protein
LDRLLEGATMVVRKSIWQNALHAGWSRVRSLLIFCSRSGATLHQGPVR